MFPPSCLWGLSSSYNTFLHPCFLVVHASPAFDLILSRNEVFLLLSRFLLPPRPNPHTASFPAIGAIALAYSLYHGLCVFVFTLPLSSLGFLFLCRGLLRDAQPRVSQLLHLRTTSRVLSWGFLGDLDLDLGVFCIDCKRTAALLPFNFPRDLETRAAILLLQQIALRRLQSLTPTWRSCCDEVQGVSQLPLFSRILMFVQPLQWVNIGISTFSFFEFRLLACRYLLLSGNLGVSRLASARGRFRMGWK